ncbi:MAG: hypothetical protein DLM69_01085 [Candidatus Chloroheliales bacterium]|nr:MAG: hypothetical protein DLM69_01085 [Chloroflexota bacterium]
MDTFSNNKRSREIKADLQAELERLEQARQQAAAPHGDYALIRLWPKMAVTLLALVGLFIAGYLALHNTHIAGGPLICTNGTDCDDVNNSAYGSWFGLPVSLFGVAGYLAIGLTALIGLRLAGRALLRVTTLQLVFATLGLLASAWFTSVEAFFLHKWCQWCVASAIIMTIIFILSVMDRRPVQRVVYEDEAGEGPMPTD